jgi:hypothetical protein
MEKVSRTGYRMNNSSKKSRCVIVLFCLVVLPFANVVAQHPSTRIQPILTEVAILWNRNASAADSIDQESYAAMMASMGFSASRLNVRELDNAGLGERTLLIIPHASSLSLSSKQVQRIVSLLEKGLRLVTGGESPLLSALHFRLGKPHRVSVVIDHNLPGNQLHWADWPRVSWIAGFPDTSAQVLYADSATGHSLVMTAGFGRGKCIVLAPHLDALSGKGYSRFPTMVNAIVRNLDCRPPFRRHGVDAYFDAGYRFSVPIDSLAAFWRAGGIRAVHAAAWYYNFDYKKLIDAAHRNGLLVYAWLEWPHVGEEFWNRHPEWRQKTALLQDAKLDFLYLMDLQNPDCMNAALDDLSRQLELDWDGVEIAEFTITGAGGEALQGPSRPDYFTSFGSPMRREFEAVAGFDPLELENPASQHFWQRDSIGLEKFFQYRRVVNICLLRRVVEFILDLEQKGKRDWELIHTIVDNTLHPEFADLLGFDLDATLKLVKEFGITLNVEDPYTEWDKPPVRYRRLRQTLLSLIPERHSMIDINVVPIHPPTQHGFASSQATGTEFLQQLQIASEQHGRVCVYCEWTVFDQDWPLVSRAMAGGSTIRKSADGWDVSVPTTVTLDLTGNGILCNNGKPWPCHGSEGITLPAGTHHLTFSNASAGNTSACPELRLLAITDELLDCKAILGGFEVTYSSPCRCVISLNANPKRILIDGSEVRLPVLKGRNSYMIMAPSGKHRVGVSGV